MNKVKEKPLGTHLQPCDQQGTNMQIIQYSRGQFIRFSVMYVRSQVLTVTRRSHCLIRQYAIHEFTRAWDSWSQGWVRAPRWAERLLKILKITSPSGFVHLSVSLCSFLLCLSKPYFIKLYQCRIVTFFWWIIFYHYLMVSVPTFYVLSQSVILNFFFLFKWNMRLFYFPLIQGVTILNLK